MSRIPLLIVVAASILCSVSVMSQTPASPGEPMTNEEATAFIKGKSLSSTRVAGGSPQIQFKDDGSMYGSNSGTDSGKWRVENGKLCMSWRRWEYEGCGQLVKAGDEVRHMYPDGNAVHLIFKK